MRIYPINNQNQFEKNNFRAKCSISGDLNVFSKSQVAEWENSIKNIGTNKDGVVIYVGHKYSHQHDEYILGLIPRHHTMLSRSIYAISTIGSKIYDKDLGYSMQGKDFDEKKYISDVISDYISSLSNGS